MEILTGLSLAAGLLSSSLGQDQPADQALSKKQKTNVILIMADDMGYETLGVNGGLSYDTPNLDQMAEQGKRFTHCYSQPLSTPSRVKIMTGLYNYRNYDDFGYLNPDETTFGNMMKQAGYATCIIGKWQLNGVREHPGWESLDRPKHFGFEEYCLWQLVERHKRYANPYIVENGEKIEGLEDAYGPDVFCDYALDYMKRKKDEPFFLYYPMVLPHSPFVPTPDSKEWADKENRYSGAKHFFKDMVEYTDKIVGRIVRRAEELGIAERTLIIFTGDNGTNRGIVSKTRAGDYTGGKAKTIDAGTHVPLVAYWSGQIEPGSVYDGMIGFSDFYATFADLAGVHARSDGKSFLSLLKDKPYQGKESVLVHYDPRIRPSTNEWRDRFARTRQYKLYQDGRFYHIPTDKLEEDPLPMEHTDWEVIQVKKKLQRMLDQAPEWVEGDQ